MSLSEASLALGRQGEEALEMTGIVENVNWSLEYEFWNFRFRIWDLFSGIWIIGVYTVGLQKHNTIAFACS